MRKAVIKYFMGRPKVKTINNIIKNETPLQTTLTYMDEWFMTIYHDSKKIEYKMGIVRKSTIEGFISYFEETGYSIKNYKGINNG